MRHQAEVEKQALETSYPLIETCIAEPNPNPNPNPNPKPNPNPNLTRRSRPASPSRRRRSRGAPASACFSNPTSHPATAPAPAPARPREELDRQHQCLTNHTRRYVEEVERMHALIEVYQERERP